MALWLAITIPVMTFSAILGTLMKSESLWKGRWKIIVFACGLEVAGVAIGLIVVSEDAFAGTIAASFAAVVQLLTFAAINPALDRRRTRTMGRSD